MAVARYYECPDCKKLIPVIQKRCDCGRESSGKEEKWKVCPACASVLYGNRLRCDCGYLFIFRRFLDKQNSYETDPEQVNLAYERGRYDGIAEEKARDRTEWDRLFDTMKLQNTFSGEPIRTREDFYKWAEEFNAAKAERDHRANKEASQTHEQQSERYLMEAANGRQVWVPADKLEEWEAAQKRGELSPGILKYKQQIKDRLLREIYGENR